MDSKEIVSARYGLGLSQIEMAVLIGVSDAAIKKWEQGRRKPSAAAVTLYRFLQKDGRDFDSLVTDVCQCRYEKLAQAKAVTRLIKKSNLTEDQKGYQQSLLFLTNPHFRPEDLGFRVIETKL